MIVDIFFIGCNTVKINDIAGESGHFPLDRGTDIALSVDPVEMIPDGHFRISGEHPAEITGPTQQCAGVYGQQTLIIDQRFCIHQFDIETAVLDHFNPFIRGSLLNGFFGHASGQNQSTHSGAD